MATPEPINEQAANWLIQLNEPDADDSLREAFDAWKRLDPRHAAAAERLQGFVGQMSALRPQKASVHAALDAAYGSRHKPYTNKRSVSALLLLIVLLLPGWALWRSELPDYLLADLRTRPAQWLEQRLPDRSLLTLNGNSAVDLRFDNERRRIQLIRGEVLVDVAHDPARPFIVETEHGQMRALGTRFVVTRENGVTVLTMLESRVAARAVDNPTPVEVSAGEQARITQADVQLVAPIDTRSVEDAWRHHQLVVKDRPLPEVLDQLARQFPGHVQFDREALADLRVSAVLPLDDSTRALNLIAEALPVQVSTFTPWLIRVTRAP
ncbi:FecR domain-containing protein [Pseudomonas sp. GD03944]|uniref:FecR family protein n=1 Tax=Pseudomonas sp. GD03944 TaxID=2975409 RepID=UPI00244D510C|nr:FecR domain-containing protein [Pseudomonas sp. GD03944]MDH1261883.1 FecR domain-containing protein [Pseudomonas sp. GD03944]